MTVKLWLATVCFSWPLDLGRQVGSRYNLRQLV
jgi:hypothetical protein